MRLFIRLILALVGLVLILVIFVVMYFNLAPQTGSDPSGERLERMKASSHYEDGKFSNLEHTDMSFPLRAVVKVLWEGIFGGPGREPSTPIPTQPFDRDVWDAVPDTSFAVAWFGHSTVLIKLDGLTILCDPVFSERGSAFTFIGPKRFPYTHHHTLDELPPVDIVLLSHDHYDHLDHASVRHLKEVVPQWLMPLGVGAHLEHWGVPGERIAEFDRWEGTSINDVRLTLVPSRHFSGRGITNRFSTLWGGWVLQGKRHRLLFGGDSGYTGSFAEIGARFGPFDLVMLECGAYNEAWSGIHMMPKEVPVAASDLRAHAVMPVHWAKFDLALHPWKEPIERLETAMNGHAVRLFTPRIGAITMDAAPDHVERWWIGVE